MIKNINENEARDILKKYFEDDTFFFNVPVRSWSVTNGRYQAIFANYEGMQGYDPLIAAEVWDTLMDHQVERFNITK